MEFPELIVESDGSIKFPQNKKYKSNDNVHINGTITIRELNFVYKYIRTSHEKIYLKKHYKSRITGTMMSEDIFESYLHHTTYHTKEEYDKCNNDGDDDGDNDNDDDDNDCEIEEEIKSIKTVLSENDVFDINDPNITHELVKEGYKIKNVFSLKNHPVKYQKSLKLLNELTLNNVMNDNCFVKFLTIKSCSEGSCELILNNYIVATIPFNTQFDLTKEDTDTNTLLYRFHNMSRIKDIDGLFVKRFHDIRIRFSDYIEDIDLVIEDVIIDSIYNLT
jgi:hypothetical protein